jgi:phenylalanyl-tRNA synthetase beta chain
MQISLKWINELVNIESINLDTLIEKLTLGGFEVEEIIELEIDNQTQIALDISATANRSDSLSIQGISTEIATLLNQPVKISNYSIKNFDWKEKLNNFSISISEEYNCSILVSVIIENLNDLTVPKWIKQKLVSSGLTPLNNLLDFQNYILLETGYPFEFYDFDKICSKLNGSNFQLSLEKAANKQEFIASNDLTYELNSSNTILQANELAISIAGIIANKEYQCTETTTSLLIEGSIFNAATIRQQSRSLGLRTDRSARYEKSLKNTYLLESLYRLIYLLRISNPKLICKLHTLARSDEGNPKPILLRYQTIKEILGPIRQQTQTEFSYLTPETITDYLTRFDFKFSYDNSLLIWKVQVPDVRSNDLTREIDLIEEIGRLHGFNNFLTTLPKINTIGIEDSSYQTRKKITSCLLNLGFTELINYSLVSKTTFLENEIKLINPLLSDCSNLRLSLLPNLIKTVQENLKQGNLFIEGFEYGHVFSKGEGIVKNFKEREYVAGIFGGIKTKFTWSSSEEALSWFEAKGKIEQLFKQLNLLTYWKTLVLNDEKILHPYRSAEIFLPDGQKLGIFGQIHPILSNQLALPNQIYLFEFDIELIQHQIQMNKLTIYREYTLYPKVVKDLSFIINKNTSFEELQTTLYANGTRFLSEINLLDEYKGKGIPEGQTSLCLQLTFQSKEKTLENKEIENIVNNLQLVLTNKFNAFIRN